MNFLIIQIYKQLEVVSNCLFSFKYHLDHYVTFSCEMPHREFEREMDYKIYKNNYID